MSLVARFFHTFGSSWDDGGGEWSEKDYDPNEDLSGAYKFLYFEVGEDQILLVGDDDIASHEGLLYRVDGPLKERLKDERPIGAGIIIGGEIENWSSDHFGLTTPEKLRATITQLLLGESEET